MGLVDSDDPGREKLVTLLLLGIDRYADAGTGMRFVVEAEESEVGFDSEAEREGGSLLALKLTRFMERRRGASRVVIEGV